jgi:hypothetical protein
MISLYYIFEVLSEVHVKENGIFTLMLYSTLIAFHTFATQC